MVEIIIVVLIVFCLVAVCLLIGFMLGIDYWYRKSRKVHEEAFLKSLERLKNEFPDIWEEDEDVEKMRKAQEEGGNCADN